MNASTSRKGNALVVVLATLLVLSIMGISFVRLASLEQNAAANFTNAVSARLMAKSGVESAARTLVDEYFTNGLFGATNWLYVATNSDSHTPAGNDPGLFAEDHVGDGVAPGDVQLPGAPGLPSYPLDTPVHGHRVSATNSTDSNRTFTLKIFDTTSQINLNTQIDASNPFGVHSNHLAELLNNLSKAVAMREPYKSAHPEDVLALGPLHGLGVDIEAERRTRGGFTSKVDLLNVAGITTNDLREMWDYITVYPTPSIMSNAPALYRNVRGANPPEERYEISYRSPVNINTAPWPVLVAVFQGIRANTVTIAESDAIVLANHVCERRHQSTFQDWIDFDEFIDQQLTNGGAFFQGGLPDPEGAAKAAIVKANCNPNVVPKRTNPDAVIYQDVNKADLAFYSTEFTFFPLGDFEITSLGQVFSPAGTLVSSVQIHSVVSVFDLQRHTSQFDFEGGRSSPVYTNALGQPDRALRGDNYLESRSGVYPYGFPNNLQGEYISTNDLLADANSAFGYITPIALDLRLMTNTAPIPGSIDDPAAYRFRADFNGSYNGVSRDQPDILPTGESLAAGAKVSTVLAVPNTPTLGGDLMPDGVVFRTGETNPLFYASRPSGFEMDIPGNFPPLTDGTPTNGTPNTGALVFWFKLNPEWHADEWRTVCFANTGYDVYAAGLGLYMNKFFCGVQREVRMNVTGPDPLSPADIDPARPWLRTVSIEVRNKFFSQDLHDDRAEEHPKNPTPDYMPCDIRQFERLVTLSPDTGWGVHAGEWYHLTIRWQDGTSMEGFPSGPPNRALAVHGNFYDAADEMVAPGGIPVVAAFDDLLGPLDNVQPYSPVDPDNLFGALDDAVPARDQANEALKADNVFFVGQVGMDPVPSMTIDDLRISDDPDCLGRPEFIPARYPLADALLDWYGVFQGRMSPTNGLPGSTLGPIYVSRREWTQDGSNTVKVSVDVPSSDNPTYELRFEPPVPLGSQPLYRSPIVNDIFVVYASDDLVNFLDYTPLADSGGYSPQGITPDPVIPLRVYHDPFNADTDNDGLPDLYEDFDADGVVDANETDPNDADTDGDGIMDGTEVSATLDDLGEGTDTGVFQPDLDPTSWTDPLDANTDGDDFDDGVEDANHNGRVDAGESDPNTATSYLQGTAVLID